MVGKSLSEKSTGSSVLTQKVYEGLRDEIVAGKLKPGDSLSRRRIAQRHGCSYTPVVEALIRLEYAGLVESESFRSPRVSEVTVERIHGDYVVREAFETQAIRLACEQSAPDEIKDLYRRAKELEALARVRDTPMHTGDAGEAPVLHWAFHRRIAELSRCPNLVIGLERISLASRFKATWVFVEGFPEPPSHHRSLVDMIQRRDPIAADAEMRAHIRKGYEREVKQYLIARTRPAGG